MIKRFRKQLGILVMGDDLTRIRIVRSSLENWLRVANLVEQKIYIKNRKLKWRTFHTTFFH